MKKYTVLCSIIAVILLLFMTVSATSEEPLLERTETNNNKIVTEEGYMTINRVGISDEKVKILISVNAQEFEN